MSNPHDYRISYEQKDAQIFREHNCKKLLEIFFADGRNLLKFNENGFEVQGIDDGLQQSHNYIKTDQTNKVGIKTTITKIFDAHLPFEDNSFEGIYSWHYLNHNYKEKVLELFKEIYRILNPKGIFSFRFTKMEDFKYKIIKGDIAETISSQEEIARGLKPEKIRILGPQTFSRFVTKEPGIPHYAYYKDELKKDLEKIGFKIVEIEGVLWNWHVWCTK